MLNLNAMFGSCESVFEVKAPKAVKSVSSTELQMMEMEITTDLAQAEVDTIKASTTMSQLDQLFNMYDHVKRFGIDRTFLSLYNSSNQLDNMLGVKFPSCESVDSEGYPNSNMSRAFIVAMEDSKEGIFSKIGKGIKWIWEKIKELCTKVWNKIMSWFSSGDTTKRLEKCQQDLKTIAGKKTFGSRVKEGAKAVGKGAWVTAKVVTAPVRGIFRFCKKHWILTTLGVLVAIPVGIATLITVLTYRALKNLLSPDEQSGSSSPSMEDYSGAAAEIEKATDKVLTEVKDLTTKLPEACETEKIDATVSNALTIVADTIDIEKAVNKAREKLDATIKKIMDFVNKITRGNPVTGALIQKAASAIQNGIKKLIHSLFDIESIVRKVCESLEGATGSWMKLIAYK